MNTNEWIFFLIFTIIHIKMKEQGIKHHLNNWTEEGKKPVGVVLSSMLTLVMHLSVILVEVCLVEVGGGGLVANDKSL